MKINKQIVVTDWIKEKPRLGSFLKLTLSSDERRILRGKKLTDCDQEIILQLPRKGKLNDGDILLTKGDYVIENMLKNFNVDIVNTQKKFFPERGAHSHE